MGVCGGKPAQPTNVNPSKSAVTPKANGTNGISNGQVVPAQTPLVKESQGTASPRAPTATTAPPATARTQTTAPPSASSVAPARPAGPRPLRVHTPFGVGEIVRQRDDGQFEVQLEWSIAYLNSDSVRVSTPFGKGSVVRLRDGNAAEVKLDWSIAFLNRESMVEGNRPYPREGEGPAYDRENRPIKVSTPFGHGEIVQQFNDGIFEVQLEWSVGYLNSDSVRVSTPFGVGSVVRLRENNGAEVKLDWATAFVNRDSLLPGDQSFPTASDPNAPPPNAIRVHTPFGVGDIVRQRDDDGVFEVQLDWARAYVNSESARVSTPFGSGSVVRLRENGAAEVKLDWSTAFVNRESMVEGNRVFPREPVKPTEPLPSAPAKKYVRASTPFGPAEIVRQRADGVFEVQLQWAAAFVNSESVRVSTPFGFGSIVRLRDGGAEVKLDWATAFVNSESMSPAHEPMLVADPFASNTCARLPEGKAMRVAVEGLGNGRLTAQHSDGSFEVDVNGVTRRVHNPRVSTPFGRGTVAVLRSDETAQVQLEWAVAYVNFDSIEPDKLFAIDHI